MVSTKNLCKIYRTGEVETSALNDVNFAMEEGEFVSIMGPSGCGKSTLLNILGLLDSPTSGQLFLDGQDVSKLSEMQRTAIRKAGVGFIFQSFNLIDELTVFENVELPLLYRRLSSKKRSQRVMEVLERMSMVHRRSYFPQQLSGGQQQRVAVARALVTDPRLLLADEPTGNLDSVHGDEVMNLLVQANRNGTTILMVTHSMHYVEYSQRTIHMLDGHIVTENFREVQGV